MGVLMVYTVLTLMLSAVLRSLSPVLQCSACRLTRIRVPDRPGGPTRRLLIRHFTGRPVHFLSEGDRDRSGGSAIRGHDRVGTGRCEREVGGCDVTCMLSIDGAVSGVERRGTRRLQQSATSSRRLNRCAVWRLRAHRRQTRMSV
jgi:hypothetical protein